MVPDEVCEAILLFNREARVSELILRKFMFSSSWTRAWVLVVVEPVELAEPEDGAAARRCLTGRKDILDQTGVRLHDACAFRGNEKIVHGIRRVVGPLAAAEYVVNRRII